MKNLQKTCIDLQAASQSNGHLFLEPSRFAIPLFVQSALKATRLTVSPRTTTITSMGTNRMNADGKITF
jgi:hypothetical protein